jgi:hypothetical protein
METELPITIQRSKKIALDFIKAKNRLSGTGRSSVEAHTRQQQDFDKALKALESDPFAQQLLPNAEEYERRRYCRKQVIQATLLGRLGDAIDDLSSGEQLSKNFFEGTIIDGEWAEFSELIVGLEENIQKEILLNFAQLLGSLEVDLAKTDLPPVPQFTI